MALGTKKVVSEDNVSFATFILYDVKTMHTTTEMVFVVIGCNIKPCLCFEWMFSKSVRV